ncbi:hypothetical protein J2S44_002084 [Catenuloplanes niger]|uniref:DUF397 domain-containing protein n=2 Tax=Micromonosporaceae TaxID=28056 RepID=A0AAE3ZN35_9ACTN|nr:hypothetical protein [Catenuloplanes niger]
MRKRQNHVTTDAMPAGWRKSTYCGSGACVEVATDSAHRYMRDAKKIDSPILAFSNAAWGSFIADVKNGEISTK